MPNKNWNQLCQTDKIIRQMFPTQMWGNNEVILTIEFYGGFELFNYRPYHNYETWSEGYRVKTGNRYGNLSVTAEDLDDALKKMQEELEQWVKDMPEEERKNYPLEFWMQRIWKEQDKQES
jgi:hypothetical protein